MPQWDIISRKYEEDSWGVGGVGGVVTVLTRALKTNRMSHYKRKPNSKRHVVNGTKISRIMRKIENLLFSVKIGFLLLKSQ